MKKFIQVFVLLFIFNCYGQFGKDPITNKENFDKQRIHFGYFVGFNALDFKFKYNNLPTEDVLVKSSIGFNLGLIANLRISEFFNIRFEPGFYFNQRDLTFPGFAKKSDQLREVKSTYLHFPILLKFSALRTGNVRPFVVGGVGAALNLSSNAAVIDDNKSSIFRMTKITNFYELGFGVDLFFDYFKFSPSIRGVFSLNDELIRDNDPNSPWTSNIESMSTRGIFVNFSFH